jgi:Ca2+-binding EF-hand superfamily protein
MEMKGSLSFEDFAMMCQFVGIDTPKKELKRTFDIIDRSKAGRVRLEDIKSIATMLDIEASSADEEEDAEKADMEPSELKKRQELDDLYEQVKDKLEKRNTTFESIIYE